MLKALPYTTLLVQYSLQLQKPLSMGVYLSDLHRPVTVFCPNANTLGIVWHLNSFYPTVCVIQSVNDKFGLSCGGVKYFRINRLRVQFIFILIHDCGEKNRVVREKFYVYFTLQFFNSVVKLNVYISTAARVSLAWILKQSLWECNPNLEVSSRQINFNFKSGQYSLPVVRKCKAGSTYTAAQFK